MVCGGQDSRPQAMRGISPTIRRRFHIGPAHQSLWTGRQLSSQACPCRRCVDPAISRAKAAKTSSVTVWGTGTPRREFLYVEDFADACIFLLKNYSAPQFVNIGCGK